MSQAHESRKLADALRNVVREQANGETALMFSGGLDSAVLAVMARKFCEPLLYTLGTEGSHDLNWARECAYVLDLPFVEIVPGREDVLRSVGNVVKAHGMSVPKWMSTFVAFDIVLGNIAESKVICGQGADELFGGYRKYLGTPDPGPMMASDLCGLIGSEFPAYARMADNHGKTLLAPYLDERIISLASAMPSDMKIRGTENKRVLRDAAEYAGVPVMMARRQKKAMQYGSGISKILKRCLKELDTDLPGLIGSHEER